MFFLYVSKFHAGVWNPRYEATLGDELIIGILCWIASIITAINTSNVLDKVDIYYLISKFDNKFEIEIVKLPIFPMCKSRAGVENGAGEYSTYVKTKNCTYVGGGSTCLIFSWLSTAATTRGPLQLGVVFHLVIHYITNICSSFPPNPT